MQIAREQPRWSIWRSPPDQPRWARPALLASAAIVAVTYTWGIAGQQPEIYYAAAVRSMAASWHDFFFAAFDPQATISLDKLPGALWIQALSVRIFGLHVWALNLPQAIEGTLTVLVLYRAVRRLSGAVAAIVAVLVYACMPATVALNRGNISDTLLILLLVCAVDATGVAIQSGRVRPLVGAGCWVGLAFQAKMAQAWLVLPAVLVVWLVAAPGSRVRRVVAAAAMVAVTGLVSLSWMLVVSAVPHGDRPYVDGSQHDSLFEQVFDYNGFTRADASAAGPAASSNSLATLVAAVTLDSDSRADRTIGGPGGRAIGWLLPIAAAGLIAGIVRARGQPRGDPQRAAAVLWGVWLAIDVAAFTVVNTINAYYLAALTVPIAALTGIAVASALRSAPLAGAKPGRVIVVGLAAATAVYGWWLLAPAPLAGRIGVAVLAVGLCGLAARFRSAARATAAALAATLIAPAFATGALIAEHGGPFTTPFEPAAARAITQSGVAAAISAGRSAAATIAAANAGARYPAAAYTSLLAAPLIFASGIEVLPIGGFTGSIPSPTLAQLMADVSQGELRTVLVVPSDDPRIDWVQANCQLVPTVAVSDISVYFCR